MAVSVEAGLSHACNRNREKTQILCLKRQMKIIEKLAVFQEERAPATTALLSPSAHLHACLLPSIHYACPLLILCFHSPFSPHCLSLLTLSLDHLLRCLFQSLPLCWTPQPWVFHSGQLTHCCWGSAGAAGETLCGEHPIQILQRYGKSAEQIPMVHSGCSQH